MPPCIVEQKVADVRDTKAKSVLQLSNIRKAIPEEAFKKSDARSIYYLVKDFLVWGLSVYGMHQFRQSSYHASMELWQQVLVAIVFWNILGFEMWCVFMIGHDCGHQVFSDKEWMNDLFGHISHGAILVPFHPWQLSHRRHHMYHNHVEKDYSHPWYTPERFTREDEKLANWVNNNAIARFFVPILSWPIYIILGMPDGNHFYPFESQRMWRDADNAEKSRCILSASVCIAYAYGFYLLSGGNLGDFAYFYVAPWFMFGWWLFAVTYLQHHGPDTLAYDDSDWKFVEAAFETVDRHFGWGIDAWHHHITDGHVVHHLFFTKIPHYNLPMATQALKKYLSENNLSHWYREDRTWDFPFRLHKYFIQKGYRTTLASTKKGGSVKDALKDVKVKAQ